MTINQEYKNSSVETAVEIVSGNVSKITRLNLNKSLRSLEHQFRNLLKNARLERVITTKEYDYLESNFMSVSNQIRQECFCKYQKMNENIQRFINMKPLPIIDNDGDNLVERTYGE